MHSEEDPVFLTSFYPLILLCHLNVSGPARTLYVSFYREYGSFVCKYLSFISL